nr:MAG TPA: hypothetical protein [Herelleviridae sp.]
MPKAFSTTAETIKARFAWKNAPNLSSQSVRQSVEKSTVIT